MIDLILLAFTVGVAYYAFRLGAQFGTFKAVLARIKKGWA